MALTNASESGLMLSAIPVADLVMATVLLGARPSGRQIAGIPVALVGVIATVLAGDATFGSRGGGYALLAGTVIAFTLYSVFAERRAGIPAIDKAFVMVVAGALTFTTLAVAQHTREGSPGRLVALPLTRPGFALAIVFPALDCTVGAFFVQSLAISSIGSNRYSTFVGVSTVTALASGALSFAWRLSLVQVLGGAAVLVGVYLANRPSPERSRPRKRAFPEFRRPPLVPYRLAEPGAGG